MKRIKLVAVTALSVAAIAGATSSFAAMSLPMGWYVDGNVGSTKTSNTNYGSGISTSSSGLGWNANVGYKFMPYFAGEIGYTKYANAKGKLNGVSVVRDNHYSYDIAGKGILPIADSGADLFAKLGFARLNSHVTATSSGVSANTGSHSASGLYIGLGGDYNFTPNLAGIIQWARAKGNTSTGNLDLYSVGIGYTFG